MTRKEYLEEIKLNYEGVANEDFEADHRFRYMADTIVNSLEKFEQEYVITDINNIYLS